MYKQDNPKNNYKNVVHAFFLSLAITIAEPSTVLPLIIEHFRGKKFCCFNRLDVGWIYNGSNVRKHTRQFLVMEKN